MHKSTKTLQEVTVSASRVRFYYRGDTVVYDATQLQLAEGSMLDALLRQLSGVELKSDGRIYHNGKFVDDLLLNGKDFFRGDRKLMLENLPAYTVKDVAIYDKQTEENEWLGRKDESSQRHVIDVRLRKEYLAGWIGNAEAGLGIRQGELPYLARLFALRTEERSRISLIVKANNLNDVGAWDMSGDAQWQRGPSNAIRHNELARLTVNLENAAKTREYYGYVDVNHEKQWLDTRTTSQTFLPGGDTYDYAFSHVKDEDWEAKLWQRMTFKGKSLRVEAIADTRYRHFRNNSGSTSGLFSAPVEANRRLLDDLFTPTSLRPNLRDTLINRSQRESKGTGHDLGGQLQANGTLKVKGSGDVLRLGFTASYRENQRQQFSRQSVAYAEEGQGSLFRHQYLDAPPRSKFEFNPSVSYTFMLGEDFRQLSLGYSFMHDNEREQESIYRLDRLPGADSSFAAPIDLLPSESEYRQVLDRSNSSLNHYIDNQSYLWADFKYGLGKRTWGQFYLDFTLSGTFSSQRNDYERGTIDTLLHRFTPTFFFKTKPWIKTKDGHHAGLEVRIWDQAPDLLNEAGILDDTDPMNIRIGNPGLRHSLHTNATLDGNLYSMNKRMHNRIDLSYGRTHNAIGMAQTYDRETGIRTFRPTNVDGNWNTYARHTINYSFGDGKKHSAQMVSQLSYRNSVDMMQETTSLASTESVVRTATLSFAPRLHLTLGKQTLGISSNIVWNRYTSDRTTFLGINAWQYRIGADAVVHLPLQFDLTTDLTLYGRTGYADPSLNTADVVWNARLARSILRGKLLVMLDGFDILGQLSNVTRTINAQGRTETYTNVMPRYALLHFVYKFRKEPKKKQ